jgi:deoxyadenosine/deoxycytidine kinase
MPIITIDGNIGSGKSTVLNHLHKHHKIAIDLEPVESWNTYLSSFYNDKNDVFKFQVRVWQDRCWVQEKSEKTLILMERSPFFIKNTFIEVVHNTGLITDPQYNILDDLYSKTDNLWCCNTYIYLRSSPENCIKRIKKRNRTCEKNITQDYIQSLHDCHETTYMKALDNKMNIIVIDIEEKSVVDVCNEILQYLQFTNHNI